VLGSSTLFLERLSLVTVIEAVFFRQVRVGGSSCSPVFACTFSPTDGQARMLRGRCTGFRLHQFRLLHEADGGDRARVLDN